jgi:chaperonin cofactor prefoldin
MVRYPMYPPPGKDMRPGEGINFNPNDQNELLDYTTKLGGCTGVYYGLMFQLGKWGFQSFKVQESIFVSPINKGYYELVIGEKEKLSQQIKSGLASIAQAYADLELILHDLRKYREYVSLFNKIKKVEVLKNKKKSEEEIKIAEEEAKRAIQTLRSIFIDQVDIHTDLPNTPIALRSIASRWPTIISDL